MTMRDAWQRAAFSAHDGARENIFLGLERGGNGRKRLTQRVDLDVHVIGDARFFYKSLQFFRDFVPKHNLPLYAAPVDLNNKN